MTRRTPPVFPAVGIIGLGSGAETVAARCAVCLTRLDAQHPDLLRRVVQAHAAEHHPHGVPSLTAPMRLLPLGPIVTVGAA